MFARHAAGLLSFSGVGSLLSSTALCDDGKDDKNDKKALQSIFDADALERGAKAVREIDRSTNAKAVRCRFYFTPNTVCVCQAFKVGNSSCHHHSAVAFIRMLLSFLFASFNSPSTVPNTQNVPATAVVSPAVHRTSQRHLETYAYFNHTTWHGLATFKQVGQEISIW
jgi:hypothetical protein